MYQHILIRNKQIYNEYNEFRKQLFSEISPKASETILYLLPWLLSINHPSCPGYVPGLKKMFRVFGIDNHKEIMKREKTFKWMFGIRTKASLLKLSSSHFSIHGMYTIGSVGTISHTSTSDCDIWICYDRKEFNDDNWRYLNQKVNLIKDWMDANLKMPVFFFICDVSDIKNSRFGQVDKESSGSTQKNVLKEEFYRTCIVICGKIPLWWVCYSKDAAIDYEKAKTMMNNSLFGHYDLIDFGDLQHVKKDEYIGAALWQIHKSLKFPLKSIIKMILLKILLDSPYNLLICHQFRERVLGREKDSIFLDPSIFTMSVILNFYKTKRNKKTLTFLTECFYLRCEIKPYEKNENLKKKLSNQLFKNFHIDMKTRITLSRFSSWNFREQMELGKRLFDFIIKQYHEITKAHAGIAGKSDQKDLTILGRKIAASYQNKKCKVPFIHRPSMRLNYPDLILSLSPDNTWRVFLDGNRKFTLVSSKSIVYCISFIVWNNLFEINRLYMEPNPSEVTIQEVINLSCKIRDFVGGSDISGNEFHYYLKKERITKILVVISFEQSSWDKNINNFSILHKNSWGELFVKQFHSHQKFKSFLLDSTCSTRDIEINHYLQRNCNCYEKIIEKAKKTITPLF